MNLIRLCALAAAYCLAAVIHADSIAVPNFSFENPDVTDGNSSTTVTGWTVTSGGPGSPAVIRDPLNAQYAVSTGNNALLPGTADGGQAAFFSVTEGIDRISTPVATIQANTRYLLTAAVGNPLDRNPASVLLELTVNGLAIKTTTIPPASIPDGTFTDFTVEFGPNSLVGEMLGIQIEVRGGPGSPVVVADVDNVRLTTTVPEPGSSAFFMACLAGILRRQRRCSLLYQSPRLS